MIKFVAASAILFFLNFAIGQTAPSASLTDEQIAKVLVTINHGEIDAAKIALKWSKNNSTRDFAKTMVNQHKTNEAETKNIVMKNKISLSKSDLSRDLMNEVRKSNKDLRKSAEDNFDKAYIDQQVAMHEKALSTLNETLIPNAKNPELLEHLKKTQTAVSMHLAHAKELQTSAAATK